MLIQFKFLMNEFPVTDTSRKIKQIITNRQKEGKWVCAVPYGYRITNTKEMTYEIDPPAAEIVREIFRLYNNGWGYKKIANHLTDQESPPLVPTRSPKKEALGKTTKRTARQAWSLATIQGSSSTTFILVLSGRRNIAVPASTARMSKSMGKNSWCLKTPTPHH